ncbi:MAG: ABC transporter permease subunit, partial [Deltaproteobacteria bacterium]|nr:ABC transporter permease subunit [Deltaproteobacteria bacterium]
AARDLGAGALRTFWHITLPLTLPGVMAGSILVFLPSLGCFYIPEILGGATNMLLGTFIKNQFLVAKNWPLGAASSSVLTLLLVLLVLLYRFTSRRSAAVESMPLRSDGEE